MKISVRPSLIRNILRNTVCKKQLLETLQKSKSVEFTTFGIWESLRNDDTYLKVHFKKQLKLERTSNKQETLAYIINSSHCYISILCHQIIFKYLKRTMTQVIHWGGEGEGNFCRCFHYLQSDSQLYPHCFLHTDDPPTL